MTKVNTKMLLKCFKRAREQGFQGDQLIDFIAACMREETKKSDSSVKQEG